MICPEPRLNGAGGSLGWSASRTPASSAAGTTAFRNYVMLLHISSSLCAPSSGERRQILYPVVIERRQPRARAAGFLVIPSRSVRVEVVLHYRQARRTGGADRCRTFSISSSRPGRPRCVWKSADHEVSQRQPPRMEGCHEEPGRRPSSQGIGGPPISHVLHAKLLHPAHARRVRLRPRVPCPPLQGRSWESRDLRLVVPESPLRGAGDFARADAPISLNDFSS